MARSSASDAGLDIASTDLFAHPVTLPVMVVLAWLLPAGPFTALGVAVLVLAIATSSGAITSAAVRLALPFVVMAAWATFMGLGHDRYDLLKDLWYGLKIALCVILGFMVGIRTTDTNRPLTGFVWFALATSLWSIATWVAAGGSAGDGLDTVGLEGFEHLALSSVVALPIVYWRSLEEVGARRTFNVAIGLIVTFSVLLSASRTTIVCAGIMMLAALGLFSSLRRIAVAAVLIAIVMYLAYLLLPSYSGGELTLAVKFRRSFDEMFLTDSIDAQQMMMNWRGFEAYNAQLLFEQSSILRQLFGNGFGTMVDLGIELRGADGEITRFLPILHNGYYYILVKYGLIGVCTYIGTLFWYILIGRRTTDISTNEDKLLFGLVMSILFATLVVTGLYNKGALQDMTILLGWLIGQGCRFRFDRQQPVAAALPQYSPHGVRSV